MRKKEVKFSMLPAGLALLFFSFSVKTSTEFSPDSDAISSTPVHQQISTDEVTGVLFTVDTVQQPASPLLKMNYTGFKAAVGFKESQGYYHKINKYGYLGKYQFGSTTLNLIGIYNIQQFMTSPKLQEAAFYANASRNKWVLKYDIDQFVGKKIGGVEITESGILAAAHLAGPGGVKRFLRTNGASGSSDAFGTSIKHYLHQFAGYDVSFVTANRYAKVDVNALVNSSDSV